jgi:hypothetical protein
MIAVVMWRSDVAYEVYCLFSGTPLIAPMWRCSSVIRSELHVEDVTITNQAGTHKRERRVCGSKPRNVRLKSSGVLLFTLHLSSAALSSHRRSTNQASISFTLSFPLTPQLVIVHHVDCLSCRRTRCIRRSQGCNTHSSPMPSSPRPRNDHENGIDEDGAAQLYGSLGRSQDADCATCEYGVGGARLGVRRHLAEV